MAGYKNFSDKVYSCLSTASTLWPFRPGYEPTDPLDVQAFQAVTIDALGMLGRELAEIDNSDIELRDFLGHYQPPLRFSRHEGAILLARSAYRSVMEAAYGIEKPPPGSRGIPSPCQFLPADVPDYAEHVIANWPAVVAVLKVISWVDLSQFRCDLDDESVRAERAHVALAVKNDDPSAKAKNINDSDTTSDSKKVVLPKLPDGVNVRDLVCRLQAELPKGKSQSQIAREFTREAANKDKKAQSLLRQARRYRHLWDDSDS
ncbi:MAG: hypothetical protein WCJ35_03455 [Planctomycetota bacterium]